MGACMDHQLWVGQHCDDLDKDAWEDHELSIQPGSAPETMSANQKEWKRTNLRNSSGELKLFRHSYLKMDTWHPSLSLLSERIFFALGQNLQKKQTVGHIYNKTKFYRKSLQ